VKARHNVSKCLLLLLLLLESEEQRTSERCILQAPILFRHVAVCDKTLLFTFTDTAKNVWNIVNMNIPFNTMQTVVSLTCHDTNSEQPPDTVHCNCKIIGSMNVYRVFK
jgi:hypothetical protein